VPEGDVLVPGIVDADPAIREGDEVLVVGSQAMATGKAAMTAAEMKNSKRGVAVRVRKVKKL
jgi:archaeosine synthase